MNKTLLVVAAHPDDEVLGCAGTVARLIREGWRAHALILGEGATARDPRRDRGARTGELAGLKRQALAAGKAVGVKSVVMHEFPDNRFDTVALLDLVKVVESVKSSLKPGMIFTHDENDLNVDHRRVFEAVLTATRPMKGETVREIYSFEIPSATDWRFPPAFRPDAFFDISSTLSVKKAALRAYASEMRPFPHPRSWEAVEAAAKYWGSRVGARAAEAFKTVRVVK